MNWVVKEPVGLNYFRFKEEEYAILDMLDGQASLDQIKEQFEAQFPPQKITLEELQHFIGSLHKSGLVISSAPGQGVQLKKRRDEKKRKELLGKFTNVLSIRFRGIDPHRLLDWLHPLFRWMYYPPVVIACLLFALSGLVLVLVQFDVFMARLPAFHQFFSAENAMALAVALALTKVIHELGHGLTCRHFGGECHEIGVLILVLTPCLYCNVSDSWMLPSKWRRAAIGAAGMYIEVVMATIAAYAWWFSEPGFLHNLCLSIMFVCSVSTLMFNANPLLRYDGYYILSDLIEIPNLRQKSSTILSRKLGQWCLGIEPPEDPFLPQRNQFLFATYAVASAIYRWIVVFSILWFLNEVFKPYRLEIIGQMIGAASLFGLIVMPLVKVAKFFWVPGRIEKVKKKRMYTSLAILVALIAGVLFIPLPYRVICPVDVRPREAAAVYVDVPGTLELVAVKPGDRVTKGQELFKISSLDERLVIQELQNQRLQNQVKLDNLRDLSNSTDEEVRIQSRMQIPQIVETLEALDEQLAEKAEQLTFDEQRRIVITSPADGIILPSQEQMESPQAQAAGQLETWTGTPFSKKNLGCYVPTGTELCQVGDPVKFEMILLIDQSEVEFVREDQAVELVFDALPGQTFQGTVVEKSVRPISVSPKAVSSKAGGDLATQTDGGGQERPQSPTFPARVEIDDPDGVLRAGFVGRAKIHAGYKTLGWRIYRWFSETFRVKQ